MSEEKDPMSNVEYKLIISLTQTIGRLFFINDVGIQRPLTQRDYSHGWQQQAESFLLFWLILLSVVFIKKKKKTKQQADSFLFLLVNLCFSCFLLYVYIPFFTCSKWNFSYLRSSPNFNNKLDSSSGVAMKSGAKRNILVEVQKELFFMLCIPWRHWKESCGVPVIRFYLFIYLFCFFVLVGLIQISSFIYSVIISKKKKKKN